MLIPSGCKMGAWLALLFGLVACADNPSPAGKAIRPSSTITATHEDAPATPQPTLLPAGSLPDLGLAPDITNEVWLNTDRPLNLSALRGKAVLVEFWTFG